MIFFFQPGNAQEQMLQGTITNGEAPLEAAHILNLSKSLQTISDGEGYFAISAAVSDTIVLSYLGFQNVIFTVDESLLDGEDLHLVMKENGIELGEVTLEYNRALDPVALGLINKRPEKLSTNERKLKEAGDFKAVQLLGILGGSVPIIPMLNKITGRTKRLKRRVAVENENNLKEYLHRNYDDFLNRELGLEKEWTDRFLYYAVVNGSWNDIYPNGNKEQFRFRLIQLYHQYTASMEEGTDLSIPGELPPASGNQ
ncbi:carboxypeptidase-like regulatory domain-containing protein [Robertkochia flava]|uniref:carboxypeptidase-like regulatory domain-containing protein n=1 Tax=Robertkochia flava TaxID=3447986 RepID=UPI001CCEF201|nr:carboxypeptidase-like regulatory domain-containing protein [Robertkochia marina]